MSAYVRPSSLGVAEFCPRSADLSEQSGIGRSAIVSTAWHAKLAGNDTLIGELHPDERKEVNTLGSPEDARLEWLESADKPLDEPITLDYVSAEKELHVQVFERDSLITEGTLDFAWVRTVSGRKWAFVADLKRSTWAIPDGPDCLQLAAYGHAYANLRGCDGYTPGLWSGTDSDWTWGTPVDLTSPEALDLWLRLKRAARNDWRLMTGQPDKQRHVTGAHCGACYGRQRCPEYALLAHDGPVPELTQENAAGLLLRAEALKELADGIKANVKAFSERGGVVKDPSTGKLFLPVVCKGKMGFDKDAAAKAGFDVEKFQKRGRPYNIFDWRKP
jgi:hypothetical protein